MTSTLPKSPQLIQYAPDTIQRAARAVRCTPFQFTLFTTMRQQSVELRSIAGKVGVENHYSTSPLAELAVENHLLWLIQVGVLRREVDGQGLTDSFRLTPLGHQLVEAWQQQGDVLPPPSWSDRLKNLLNRWLRLPGWMQLG